MYHTDEILLDYLNKARPISLEHYHRALSLWDEYTDPNPLRFVQSCLQGDPAFPELAPLWALLSNFFPRKTRDGELRLGRMDELILSILSTKSWTTSLSVFGNKSAAGDALRELFRCLGDLVLQTRLDHWVAHGSSIFVERGPSDKPKHENPMISLAYRLTERGTRLRDEGLQSLADAPSLPIGGTEAYGAPWVLLDDGTLAQV